MLWPASYYRRICWFEDLLSWIHSCFIIRNRRQHIWSTDECVGLLCEFRPVSKHIHVLSMNLLKLKHLQMLWFSRCEECGNWSFIKNRLKTHTREMHGVLAQFSCLSDCSSVRTDILLIYPIKEWMISAWTISSCYEL